MIAAGAVVAGARTGPVGTADGQDPPCQAGYPRFSGHRRRKCCGEQPGPDNGKGPARLRRRKLSPTSGFESRTADKRCRSSARSSRGSSTGCSGALPARRPCLHHAPPTQARSPRVQLVCNDDQGRAGPATRFHGRRPPGRRRVVFEDDGVLAVRARFASRFVRPYPGRRRATSSSGCETGWARAARC
jgi:hypothetical protein